MTFGGVTYDPKQDAQRLGTALDRVVEYMADGEWRTLPQIARACGCSEAGASARLRDLRKPQIAARYGVRAVHSKRKFHGAGLWHYCVEKERA
jgi:DNA-binding Lrp family transcriptional regulator